MSAIIQFFSLELTKAYVELNKQLFNFHKLKKKLAKGGRTSYFSKFLYGGFGGIAGAFVTLSSSHYFLLGISGGNGISLPSYPQGL